MRLLSPQWVAVAATLVVVGGSVTAGYLHWHDDAEAPATEAAPIQPGVGEADAVADALRLLTSKPLNLVATDVQSAVSRDAAKAVPKGATVTPNEASWHPDGLGGGTMTVTVAAGGKSTTYSAIMIKERSGWKVLGTVPMYPNAAAAPPVPTAPEPVPGATPGAPADPAAPPDGTQPGPAAGTQPAPGPAAGQPAAVRQPAAPGQRPAR